MSAFDESDCGSIINAMLAIKGWRHHLRCYGDYQHEWGDVNA